MHLGGEPVTSAESQQYSIPSQTRPSSAEAVPLQQANPYETWVTGLDGVGLAAFEGLVKLIRRGHAELLEGYLMQRARTPDASTLDLLAQMRAQHLPFVTINTKRPPELACLYAVISADLSELPLRFQPDNLRPADVAGVLTEAATRRLAQDSTYDSLARQTRAQLGEAASPADSEWGGRRDFARELGFHAVGLVASWAADRRGRRQRNRRNTAGM